MSDLVIDTHTAIWYFAGSQMLSASAYLEIENSVSAGRTVLLCTISIVEIVYLIDKQRLSSATLPRLIQALRFPGNGFRSQDLTEEIAVASAQISRETVPDMPDRIIAATALYLDLPLVTKDQRIQALTNIRTIW